MRGVASLVVLMLLASPVWAARSRRRSPPMPVPLRTLQFPTDVHSRQLLAPPKDVPVPKEVRFVLEGEPRLDGERVLLTGALENPTADDVAITILPSGSGTNPIYLELKPDAHVSFHVPGPREPPRPPAPAPPPPRELVVPAHARIVFTGELELGAFDWSGTPEASFAWAFLHRHEPRTTGTFKLTLPTR